MSLSIAGALVFAGLLLLGRYFEKPLIVAFFASFTFGSTALFSLSALGGATPLLSAVFVLVLVGAVALRPNSVQELAWVFKRQHTAWFVLLLVVYVVLGALLLPRLLEGQTAVFILNRESGTLAELPLMPGSGNITQTLYFVLSSVTFFAFCILLRDRGGLNAIRQGIFVWATLHVTLGFVDLGGKMVGAGDVLAPIRSASYVMLTEVEAAGFWRITGSYPEASTFGAITACLLAFMFTFWRTTNERWAYFLSLSLAVLLMLSTSTTAYVTGGVLALLMAVAALGYGAQNRLRRQDILVFVLLFVTSTAIVAVYVYNERALDPVLQLLNTMVFDKSTSASAVERAYFNQRSLQNFVDTFGMGVGIGSSRASSWVIAVVSQLGLIGSILIAYLTFELFRTRGVGTREDLDLRERGTVGGMRACALAYLIGSSISAGAADPGMVYFITLATMVVAAPTPIVAQNALRLPATPHLFQANA